jgi:DNA-directed RNA polymerase subunit RPC12/RpoP
MEGLKPPFLVLGTHHSFTDFYITPLALFPYRANYVSELEGFELYGEWLYRQIGCLGTRKFVNDISLINNIRKVIERKDILVMYPEARYANVGTNSKLTKSVGKLAKMLNVPVVVIQMRGNYLQSPIWNLKLRKEARLDTTITQVFTAEELAKSSLDEVNKTLRDMLTYDEYSWQYETKLKISYGKRAEGIELVLYQCPVCRREFRMESNNDELFCKICESKWRMTEYGKMELITNSLSTAEISPDVVNLSHIPSWYEWERKQVEKEIDSGRYSLSIRVHIESLPNAVNFIDLGEGLLMHNEQGFSLTFTEYGDLMEKTLSFAPRTMSSVHTEYNYRKKGQCITLSTIDNTYFLFSREDGFNVTKIQFATEYFYEKAILR